MSLLGSDTTVNESSQVPRGPTRICTRTCEVGQEKPSGGVLTVALAVSTKLVVGLLYELAEDLCVALGGRLVWLVHRAQCGRPGLGCCCGRVYSWLCYNLFTTLVHVCTTPFTTSTTTTMSTPATRAEARRKAILGRGGDRLAKLTTSARGEEASAYLHNGESIDVGDVQHSRRRWQTHPQGIAQRLSGKRPTCPLHRLRQRTHPGHPRRCQTLLPSPTLPFGQKNNSASSCRPSRAAPSTPILLSSRNYLQRHRSQPRLLQMTHSQP